MSRQQLNRVTLLARKLLSRRFVPLDFQTRKVRIQFIVEQRRSFNPLRRGLLSRCWCFGLSTASVSEFRLKLFSRTRYREHFVIQELFDPQSDLYVTLSIAALPGLVFLRRKAWKLGFPIAQHVRLNADDLADQIGRAHV